MGAKVLVEACERNKGPILERLREVFAHAHRVIEVGSGSGQHAVHFAGALGHLTWQPTELAANLDTLGAGLEGGPPNLLAPFEFDVRVPARGECDALFSANTLHIMGWDEVRALFAGIPALLVAPRRVAIYGPFRYAGRHTSPSNERFDAGLRSRAAHMGVRDAGAVDALAIAAGLRLAADFAMPANNRLIVWRESV